MPFLELGEHRLSAADVDDLLATDHLMVERFRFDKQSGAPGQNVHFALVIVPRPGVRYQQQRDDCGHRITPVWRTLSASDQIGQGNRAMWVKDGEVEATNKTFFPNQEFNDLGIGSALYVSMERLYRHLGVRRVSLLAVDVGVYVWARQAFAFMQPGQAQQLVPSLERFLYGHGASMDFDPASLQESWDLANFGLPGQDIDGYRAGKAFMLRAVPGWHGLKLLDDEVHNAVAEASRRETFARLPDKIAGATQELAVR